MNVGELGTAPEEALLAGCCVVGTGPAGLTIARELAGSGIDVLLLESGGLQSEDAADALGVIESIGAPRRLDHRALRNRILGGTSHTWSGRTVVLDPIDFEARPWLPHTGWPVDRASLLPYFERSREHLGAPVADNDDPAFVRRVTAGTPAVDEGRLKPYAWPVSSDAADPADAMRFGPRALAEPMPGVRCLVHATVTAVRTDAGRVTELEVADREGRRRIVRAQIVVLAAGALENARLLLVSDIGTEHGMVGRFLTDHLRGPVGIFPRSAHRRLQRVFGDVRLRPHGRATPGFALAPELQRRERLTNCAAWLQPTVGGDDPFTALARARNAPLSAIAAVLRHGPMLAEGAVRLLFLARTPVRRLAALELHVIVEQAPDPQSRIVLAEQRDAHGVPLTRVDWRVSEVEAQTVRRTTELVVHALSRAGLPAPRLLPVADGEAPGLDLPDVAHPMGTTRMSVDPRDGVVDPDCRVHGVENLYIAGSSVFPSGGHANPTQTIVALAVRLADELRVRAADLVMTKASVP